MFKTVKSNKISENIINQIRLTIFEGKLKPGDKLPSEKELMEKFHVSKATLREALRSLEVLGFLEIKQGFGGGAYVVEVDVNTTKQSMANFLRFKNLSISNLSEVRSLIEPYIAEWAALKRTQNELLKLHGSIQECEQLLGQDLPVNLRENEIEFHKTIAGITRNPILILIIDFVGSLLIDTKGFLQPSKVFSLRVLKAHKRIYRALLEKNAEKARTEMFKHVKQVEKDLFAIRKAKKMAQARPGYGREKN